jgi:hypothetical protein
MPVQISRCSIRVNYDTKLNVQLAHIFCRVKYDTFNIYLVKIKRANDPNYGTFPHQIMKESFLDVRAIKFDKNNNRQWAT